MLEIFQNAYGSYSWPMMMLFAMLGCFAICFLVMGLKDLIDWYYDNQLGKNNSSEWAVGLNVLEHGKSMVVKNLYHTQCYKEDRVVFYAQLLPRDATVFTDMLKARAVCEAYVTNKDSCRSSLMGKQYYGLTIRLLEKRSYLGFKAWHCIHQGIPDQ